MNTPSEPLSNMPLDGPIAGRRVSKTVVAVVVVGVLVVAIAVIAGLLLANASPNSDWIPVYQDVLKTSFGALAVGGLGGLAKLIFDQRNHAEADEADRRKHAEAAADELRDRRYDFISALVAVSHDIDTAKLVMRANRSVKSWTEMVNERIIPAQSRLRNMIHDLNNWKEAELPVFDDTDSIVTKLEGMNNYLKSLLGEYGENKQALGELQLKAEDAKTTKPETRKPLLDEIWADMFALRFLGNLIKPGHPDPKDDRPSYGPYRDNYIQALLIMRSSLAPKKAEQSPAPVIFAQGVTTSSLSGPR